MRRRTADPKLNMFMMLVLFIVAQLTCAYTHRHDLLNCEKQSNSLALYRVTLDTTWTEDRFPKQFPTTRPNAQWSKMIGRSHNDDYELWSKGGQASPGFKEFAETGESSILQTRETQGFNGLHDAFTAPPIQVGAGSTQVDFFANHNHSMVSLAARLIPSPDWFVGIDRFDLCRNGTWIKNIRMQVEPHDAGTDMGFTFTSPNWASKPQEKVYKITSQHPDHTANSFYYPELEQLPSIAELHFQLLTVFRHEHTVHHVSHWKETLEGTSFRDTERNKEEMEERLILAGEPIGSGGGEVNQSQRRSRVPNDRSAETEETMDRSVRVPVTTQQIRELLPPKVKKLGIRKQDCQVGDWSAWSPCSKTCGFGSQKRFRKVTQIPRSGRACPILEQQKWCGSMRSCRTTGKTSLFSWVDKKSDENDD